VKTIVSKPTIVHRLRAIFDFVFCLFSLFLVYAVGGIEGLAIVLGFSLALGFATFVSVLLTKPRSRARAGLSIISGIVITAIFATLASGLVLLGVVVPGLLYIGLYTRSYLQKSNNIAPIQSVPTQAE